MIELLLQAERALEMGRIDAAETLYRQVSDADPRNSIAVVGLARVSLERGDELGAYLTARRALAIDGENAAASRMVQRLEEVMRFRGDPVPDVPDVPEVPEAPDAPDAGAAAETPVEPAAQPAQPVPAPAQPVPARAPAEPAPAQPVPAPAPAQPVPVPAKPTGATPTPTRSASPQHDDTLTPVAQARRRRSIVGRVIARILGRG